MMRHSKYSFLKIGSWNIQGAYVKVNNYYVNKLRDDEFFEVGGVPYRVFFSNSRRRSEIQIL